jgi:hypothetical protein
MIISQMPNHFLETNRPAASALGSRPPFGRAVHARASIFHRRSLRKTFGKVRFTMDVTQELKALLRNVVADGDYGMTVRSGEPLVVHTKKGPRSIEAPHTTHEEVVAFLRQLLGSRGVREFRANGVTRFMVPFDGGVRFVGAARQEDDHIHVEIRRMAANR